MKTKQEWKKKTKKIFASWNFYTLTCILVRLHRENGFLVVFTDNRRTK